MEKKDSPLDDYLTIGEAAKELKVSESRVKALLYGKRIPGAEKKGDRFWLIPKQGLEMVRVRKPGRPGKKK